MTKTKCPNCSAVLKFNKETNESVCEYCGYKHTKTKTLEDKQVEIAENVEGAVRKVAKGIKQGMKYAWIPGVIAFLAFVGILVFVITRIVSFAR